MLSNKASTVFSGFKLYNVCSLNREELSKKSVSQVTKVAYAWKLSDTLSNHSWNQEEITMEILKYSN